MSRDIAASVITFLNDAAPHPASWQGSMYDVQVRDHSEIYHDLSAITPHPRLRRNLSEEEARATVNEMVAANAVCHHNAYTTASASPDHCVVSCRHSASRWMQVHTLTPGHMTYASSIPTHSPYQQGSWRLRP
jgi:hypothetical protein